MFDPELAARLDAWHSEALEGGTAEHAAVALLMLAALAGMERGELPALARRAWALLHGTNSLDSTPEGDTLEATDSGGTRAGQEPVISDRVFRLMVRRYELQEDRYWLKRRRDEIRQQCERRLR